MKTLVIRATLAPALLATAVGSASAAFTVRRSTEPGSVATSAPAATIVAAPFDDSAARLVDGQSYFYAVYDAAGRSVELAVTRNTVAGCLRLSFDDGNPTSAPVSATQSSLAVAPSAIRADGVQSALVSIVPRDAAGVLLGRGLAVAIDASLLWPGRLEGPLDDLGDGTYRARVVSDLAGRGSVNVTVEGVPLVATTVIDFVALDPGGSLRDLAILRLKDMTATGGRFADLLTSAGGDSPQADALQQAWDDASQALRALANGDTNRDDNVLKSDLDAVLRDLAPLLDQPGALDAADVRDLLDDLLDTARLVAVHHLGLAEVACGSCAAGSRRKVCEAQDALDGADDARVASHPDWTKVVDGYARSVELSLQAAHGC